jgi:hypothetical protein
MLWSTFKENTAKASEHFNAGCNKLKCLKLPQWVNHSHVTLGLTVSQQAAAWRRNTGPLAGSILRKKLMERKNSVAWVRERTIPTERQQLVGEVSANFRE